MLEARLRVQRIAPHPAIEVDSYGSIKRLVESGYGCSVLPFHSVAEEARDGRLTVRRFARPRLWRGAYLAQATARRKTRAASVVGALLKDLVQELIDARIWAGARRPGATGKGGQAGQR